MKGALILARQFPAGLENQYFKNSGTFLGFLARD